MERPFIGENALQRQRLKSLINRITDAQLNLPLISALSSTIKTQLDTYIKTYII